MYLLYISLSSFFLHFRVFDPSLLHDYFIFSFFLQVIHDRLSCGAIFDFLDYIQPDDTTWARTKPPDTGVILLLAIASTWYNFISWMIAFLIYYIMARRKLCIFWNLITFQYREVPTDWILSDARAILFIRWRNIDK